MRGRLEWYFCVLALIYEVGVQMSTRLELPLDAHRKQTHPYENTRPYLTTMDTFESRDSMLARSEIDKVTVGASLSIGLSHASEIITSLE